MHRAAGVLALWAVAGWGQGVVAPTREPVGTKRGDNKGNYNITNSFELGARYHEVGGNGLKYRSDVNFGNGVRLLGTNLTVHSRDGQGGWLDEMVLSTQGLGNDPYQTAKLRAQKNGWYRYDMFWRINDYVNPGLTTGTLGGHLLNTRRQMQDHDFTLFPEAGWRVVAGTSRVTQTGAGLTSFQWFDGRGDEFPLFADVNRRFREYRVGVEGRGAGFRVGLWRGWQRFEEVTPERLEGESAGANVADNTQLARLVRREPYEGETPFWRMNVNHERKTWYGVAGSFSYAGSRRAFTLDETGSGTDRLGVNRTRQVIAAGTGRRPVTTGSLTLSLLPGARASVSNHTAFHQAQMDGDNVYREVNNNTLGRDILRFEYLGLRTVVNTTDGSVEINRWLGVYGGFHYSQRRIRSRQAEQIGVFGEEVAAEQGNVLKSGLGGVRVQAGGGVSVNVDVEVGRADRPFYPVAERNYQAVGGRAQYRSRKAQLFGAVRTNYNTNSVSLFTHSARARNYSAGGSWTVGTVLVVDASYSKLHVDTLTGIAYFALGNLVDQDQSLYISNIHAGSLGARLSLWKRADLYVGYSRVQDAGDGRSRLDEPGAPGARSPLAAFRAVQTFPVAYQSPLGRLSVRLRPKLRWNVGYQWYGYRDELFRVQNYRAHTGYSSLLWSF